MKHLKYLSLAVIGLATTPVFAETVAGEIIEMDGNLITIETNDNQQMTFKTTDDTTYRKKKLKSHHKKKRGMRSPKDWHFYPIAEEDDWVEIVYDPKTETAKIYEVDTITVFND